MRMDWVKKHWSSVGATVVAEGMIAGLGYILTSGIPKVAVHPWVIIGAVMSLIPLLMFWLIRSYEKRVDEARTKAILAAADMDNFLFKEILESHGKSYKFTLDELLKFYKEHLHLRARVDDLERTIRKT